VLAIARDGLKARGLGEEMHLDPVDAIVATGQTQADRWLDRCARVWGGDVSRIFGEAAV
jgi:glutamate--cysteine ligase